MMRRIIAAAGGIIAVGCAVAAFSGYVPKDTFVSSHEVVIALPGRMEDAARVVVLGLVGLTLGELFLISTQFSKIQLSEKDKLVRPLSWVAFAFFLQSLFVGMEMISKLGADYLTWRTPLALLTFLVSTLSLWNLVKKVSYAAVMARSTDAKVKFAIIDTGKPGPDIDLDTQEPVEQHPISGRTINGFCPQCAGKQMQQTADGVVHCPICGYVKP